MNRFGQNEISLRYLWASEHDLPVKFVLVEEGQFLSAYQIAAETVEEEAELLGPSFTEDEVIMLWVHSRGGPSHVSDDDFARLQAFRKVATWSLENLNYEYGEWLRGVENQTRKDREVAEEIQGVIQEMEQIDPLPYSPIIFSRITIETSPTLEGLPLSASDGLTLFDEAILSKDVPFLAYRDEKEIRYKIFEPVYAEDLIPETDRLMDKQYIYYQVRTKEDNYVLLTWNLIDNVLTGQIPLKLEEEGTILSRWDSCHPNVRRGPTRELRVSSSLTLWEVSYQDASLLDVIMLDKMFSLYFHLLEETHAVSSERRKLSFRYRAIGGERKPRNVSYANARRTRDILDDAEISLEKGVVTRTAIRQQLKKVENGEVISFTPDFEQGDYPYISLNITNARSRQMTQDLVEILRRLMSYYFGEREEPLVDLYSEFLGRDIYTELEVEDVGKKESQINKLTRLAPAIFSGNCGRKCQKESQPDILETEEEVRKAEEEGLDVMMYPLVDPDNMDENGNYIVRGDGVPNEDTRWFTCRHGEYPYVGIQRKKMGGKGKSKYPHIIHCFKTNQKDPTIATSDNREWFGLEGGKARRTSEITLSSNKVLRPGQEGTIPPKVVDFLRGMTGGDDFVRRGVPDTPRALLSAVLYCLGKSGEEEKTLRDLQKMPPEVFRSELYDYNDEETRELLFSGQWLDSRLLINGVEELLKVNIVVFYLPPDSDDTKVTVEIPRFKGFPVRTYWPNRQTVYIFKYWGSERDERSYPHFEPVVERKAGKQTISLWPEVVGIRTQQVLRRMYSTLTLDRKDNQIQGLRDLYNLVDCRALFSGYQVVGQSFDNWGKVRSFTLLVGGSPLTVVVPPSRPLPVPLQEPVSASLDRTLTLFSSPPAAISKEGKKTIGLWFPFLDSEIFVPIKPSSRLASLPEKPSPLLHGPSKVERMLLLEKSLAVITQTVKWIFLLLQEERDTSPEEFFETYIRISDDVSDSTSFYDFSSFPSRLPLVSSVKEALSYLRKHTTNYVSEDGGVMMYNEKFAYKMFDYIRRFYNGFYGLTMNVPREIVGVYEYARDFRRQRHVSLIVGNENLEQWMKQAQSTLPILRQVGSDNYPYFLISSFEGETRAFLVQSVPGKTLREARALAYHWQRYKENVLLPQEIAEPVPVPVLIMEEKNKVLSVKSADNLEAQGEPILLLAISLGYAALLPLL